MARGKIWTAEEVTAMVTMKSKLNMSWHRISCRVGHTVLSCQAKYLAVTNPDRERKRRPYQPSQVMRDAVSRIEAKDAQLAERDRRYEAAEARSLTSRFFGDPPPGFSALDHKRGLT